MASNSEQEEKLSVLLAIAGDMVDREVARALLESADWDVERALNGLLEDQTPTAVLTEASGADPPASSISSVAHEQTIDLSSEDLRALLDACEIDHSMCLGKNDLVNLLEKSTGQSGSHGGVAFQPTCGRSRCQSSPAEQVDPVCLTCDLGHPLVPHPSSGNTCDVGGKGCKGFGTSFRCASGCDFDACDVCCPQDCPAKWEHRFTVLQNKFPWATRSLVLRTLKKHSGAACLVENELQEISSAKEEQARLSAERQAEVAMQNEEFRESLLMDQHREAQCKLQAEEAEEAKLEAQEAERKLQAEKVHATHEAELAFEAKRLRVSQPEPDKTHPDRCQIVIRTPSGKRLTRTFLGSNEVSFMYDWIDTVCAEDVFVKEHYQVVSRLPGRPSKTLCKSSQTLKEEEVEHQTVFFISS